MTVMDRATTTVLEALIEKAEKALDYRIRVLDFSCTIFEKSSGRCDYTCVATVALKRADGPVFSARSRGILLFVNNQWVPEICVGLVGTIPFGTPFTTDVNESLRMGHSLWFMHKAEPLTPAAA